MSKKLKDDFQKYVNEKSYLNIKIKKVEENSKEYTVTYKFHQNPLETIIYYGEMDSRKIYQEIMRRETCEIRGMLRELIDISSDTQYKYFLNTMMNNCLNFDLLQDAWYKKIETDKDGL